MGRLIIVLAVMFSMSGCAVVGAVSGAAVEGVVYLFKGEEESFPVPMRGALAVVQRVLKKSGLHANVMEPVEDGYLIAFGNDKLDGKISFEKRTESLTTVGAKVRNGALRQDSVERALINSFREESKKVKASDRFDFRNHKEIYEKPDLSANRVGWYLPGTLIEVSEMSHSDWMRIKMPSGKVAFLKGDLAASASK